MPIVYAYEDEINEFYKLNANEHKDKKIISGFAFEWKGENVFHVHTHEPKNTISGYPCQAIFIMLPISINFDEVEKKLNSFLDEHFSLIENNGRCKIIVCVFQLQDKNLRKKAFLKSTDGLHECQLLYVPQKAELYSRSKGLLEVDILEKKNVAIIGLGSFGSNIAIELAKAGIGNFTLFDFDRIELSNIARHTCGVDELGRFKTRAIRDSILQKNPFAKVKCYEININECEHYDLVKSEFEKTDIILCLTDENQSRNLINTLSIELKKTTLFGRAITRAEGGDVFRLRGRNSDAPCLACVTGKGIFSAAQDEVSTLKQAKRDLPAYVSEEDEMNVVQVGLSSDIAPICNMVVKLALIELSKGLNSGITSLEEDLTADYYFWVNRRENKYKQLPKMEYFANKISVLRWYGVRTKKNHECLVCNTNID